MHFTYNLSTYTPQQVRQSCLQNAGLLFGNNTEPVANETMSEQQIIERIEENNILSEDQIAKVLKIQKEHRLIEITIFYIQVLSLIFYILTCKIFRKLKMRFNSSGKLDEKDPF